MAGDSGTIQSNQDNTILGDFWANFNVDGPSFDVVECADASDSMAEFVLDQYGIDIEGGAKGGPLASIDIKRMDAMTVINQSLMEEFPGTGRLVEAIVTENGGVKFVEIGNTGDNGIEDVYYTVQTHSHVDTVKGVMVTGKKPLPLKLNVPWKPIWGEGENESLFIYNYQDMLANCNLSAFSRYVTMTFNDPYLDSSYNDGLNNLFNVEDPWEQFIGYAYWIDPPEEYAKGNNELSINYTNTSTVPLQIGKTNAAANGPIALIEEVANLGTLQNLPQYDVDSAAGDCWSAPGQGEPVDCSQGIEVPIRDNGSIKRFTNVRNTLVDMFIKINSIYVIGLEIDFLVSSPATDADAKKSADNKSAAGIERKRWVSINDKQRKAFKLIEGKNYATSFKEAEGGTGTDSFPIPCVVFAKESNVDDPEDYGTDVKFWLDPGCKVARSNDNSTASEYNGSILPINKNRGILVEQIWALIDLESPSIVINDPSGHALDIANDLKYYIGRMAIRKEPAPIGFAGEGYSGSNPIDQAAGFQDSDPTTAQNFNDLSELDEAAEIMQGGGMSLTLSFLDEDGVVAQAERLYEYMQYDGVSTVHTCGPCANPQLGARGTTGIINSVQYSYSDKGSYTISVQEGPYIVGGLTPVDGGPTQKMVEEYQAKGTIIKDAGNSVHFKIRIDGFGERWAVSTVPTILRVGDVVSATVHNVPVEA